ncbi:MAG: hypothetical protein EAZ60_24315 [Oscillatoriales cyanobacterium]|nr:MAG: hypothetical protein EAZ73_25910 [Oscillatoriales cyanobacterium]TAF34823.1 MAG: hypothetical protein EAZ69_14260 [Oscillatoriales cyanobacterium]TAF52152.1 MAG: hypothetical protein EAZ60_24315 [Oscillatoriales cyanobacterium]
MSPPFEGGLGGIEGLILIQQTGTTFDVKLTPIPVSALGHIPPGNREWEEKSWRSLRAQWKRADD